MKNKLETQKRKLGKHLKVREFYCSFPKVFIGVGGRSIMVYKGVMMSHIAPRVDPVTPQFLKDALKITCE